MLYVQGRHGQLSESLPQNTESEAGWGCDSMGQLCWVSMGSASRSTETRTRIKERYNKGGEVGPPGRASWTGQQQLLEMLNGGALCKELGWLWAFS